MLTAFKRCWRIWKLLEGSENSTLSSVAFYCVSGLVTAVSATRIGVLYVNGERACSLLKMLRFFP